MSMKNSNDTIGNRTRDLPACSVVLRCVNTRKVKQFLILVKHSSIYFYYDSMFRPIDHHQAISTEPQNKVQRTANNYFFLNMGSTKLTKFV